jgi:capsular exopolysaccharide synthesis family protein
MLGGTVYRARINRSNNHTVTDAKNYFVQFNSISGAATTLISDLKAMAISISSTVLDIKLETPVPQKGLDVLNKLFEIYNRNAIIDKNQISAKTIDFIEDRLRMVISQLDSVERNVASFRSRESVYDLSSQAQMYLENVKDLDKKSTDIDIQLSVINDINNYVHNKGRQQGTVPSLLLVNEPVLSSLVEKLYQAEVQLERAKSISGDKSDAVLLYEQQVSDLKNNIIENVSSIRRNLLAVKSKLNSNIGENTGLLRQIPQKERAFIDISRQQAIKNNIYTFLLQKREETAISSASTIADLRIIETPNAYGPIKPIANNYYLIGFLIGLCIPVFYILVHEQFNRKILFRAEIEEKTKVPMLAEIVQVGSKEPIVISEGKRTVIAEQFRSLRTNLSFMGGGNENKTILVTSSIPSEGKSFIAINLAISITLTGKKVALLELDLRKPKLSKIMKISRDPGISNYLIGKATIDEIMKKTAINNRFISSAGPIPPNPTELILGEKFGKMMAELRDRFDYLIIDTAPTGHVSDAQLL